MAEFCRRQCSDHDCHMMDGFAQKHLHCALHKCWHAPGLREQVAGLNEVQAVARRLRRIGASSQQHRQIPSLQNVFMLSERLLVPFPMPHSSPQLLSPETCEAAL